MTLPWAWSASRHVDPVLKVRLMFVAAALRESRVSNEFATADPKSQLGRLLSEWPQTVGLLLWPYQCASWDAAERLTRVKAHLACVDAIPGLQLPPGEKLILLDLSSYSPGISLVLDRAEWLTREGHLTLSLFKGDFRAFTLSFSLSGYPNPELFIGGLQGRQTDDALDIYRELTKDFEGVRPRDLILEMLRIFSVKTGVRHIYAVADDHKIFRHKYFGKKALPGLTYDDVWRDRSGVRVAETHFELPLHGSRRPIEEIAAKKRSMYRRRYEMLDQIEAAFPTDFTKVERRSFEAT
jgi:uncharacterized protein VirK/YbjX